MAKRKDEQGRILQYQQALKTRALGYRTMELNLLEKVRKDMEEKEAQETKVPSVVTYPDGNKGKIPMEYIPHLTVS